MVQLVGKILKDISKSYLEKRGYMIGALINDWPLIIGESYAPYCAPENISFFKKGQGGTLQMVVYSQSMILSLHHLQPVIIEKINTYFGYKAVDKITFKKGIMPFKKPLKVPTSPRPIDPQVNKLLDSFPDGDLKESLRGLGHVLE